MLGDLSRARWAKLNEEELFELSDVPDSSPEGLLAAAADFRRQLELELLLLTRGADGATMLRSAGPPIVLPAAAAGEVADTVGAGDAITAVTMLGLARGWDGATILESTTTIFWSAGKDRGGRPRDWGAVDDRA